MQKSIRSHEASLKFSFFCLWLTYGEQNLNILKPNSVETVQAVSEGISGKELFSLLPVKPHLLAQIQICF